MKSSLDYTAGATVFGLLCREALADVQAGHLTKEAAFREVLGRAINASGAEAVATLIMETFGDEDVTRMLQRRYLRD